MSIIRQTKVTTLMPHRCQACGQVFPRWGIYGGHCPCWGWKNRIVLLVSGLLCLYAHPCPMDVEEGFNCDISENDVYDEFVRTYQP